MMVNKGIIRLARPEEAPLLSALALRSKGYWGYNLEFLTNCKEELSYTCEQLASPANSFQVAVLPKQIIAGFFALNFLGTEHPELDALFVDPKYIGKGWGKHLLSAAILVAKSHQAKTITLHSEPFAENFYLQNGATKVGETESQSIPGRFLPLLEICL